MFCYILREVSVNEVFYSRFKFKCSFLFRWSISVYMGGAYHLTSVLTALPWAIRSKICIFHLVYLLKARMNFDGNEWLIKVDWKNFGKSRNVFGTILQIQQKIIIGRAAFLETLQTAIIFQSFPCNEKMSNSSRKALQTYSEMCIFCVCDKIYRLLKAVIGR